MLTWDSKAARQLRLSNSRMMEGAWAGILLDALAALLSVVSPTPTVKTQSGIEVNNWQQSSSKTQSGIEVNWQQSSKTTETEQQ